MTGIYNLLETQDLDNRRFNRLLCEFRFQSDVLARLGLREYVTIPAGFVQDLESVPLIRGTNARGGLVHDYLCRIDSDPVVTKAQAAEIYYEIMIYCYALDTKRRWWNDLLELVQAKTKWAIVRVAWGYFHKHYVLDSAEDIAGCKADPFITERKGGKK
jgi:hypothetical protein